MLIGAKVMTELWSYEKKKRVDSRGTRWHFMHHDVVVADLAYEERPYELYFRDDAGTTFGLLRFERRKDNPYRDYELIVRKIMEDSEFRKTLLDPSTKGFWR